MNVEIKDVKPNENDVNTVGVNTVADDNILDNIIQDLNNRCLRIITTQRENLNLPFRAMTVGRGNRGVDQSQNILLNICDIVTDTGHNRKGLLGIDPRVFSFKKDKSSVIRDMQVALEILRAFSKGCK